MLTNYTGLPWGTLPCDPLWFDSSLHYSFLLNHISSFLSFNINTFSINCCMMMWLCIFVWLIYRQEMCVWSVVFVVTVLVGTNSVGKPVCFSLNGPTFVRKIHLLAEQQSWGCGFFSADAKPSHNIIWREPCHHLQTEGQVVYNGDIRDWFSLDWVSQENNITTRRFQHTVST